ncbi:hypothetical protein A6A19_01985 [Actinobacillus delphinicola]|uniref:type IV pilus biogenesis/stability protein PilW n=1 Tax=Actinobacillus delphinicola TaxID=51161 RepID=UPI002442137B|nr:type IV pilus biogenesis/stability protein PilW [Actinobacillus delphinicola]MDG6896797.1 hypothetical protein [Actinobacillus delphinicola]
MLKIKSKLGFIGLVLLSASLTACSNDVASSQDAFNKQAAAKARVDLALGFLTVKNFSEAKRNLDKAASYTPNSPLVSVGYAYFYQLQRNIPLTEKYYQKAINEAPQQGDIKNNYGVFLCETAQYLKAYHQFDLALALPNYYHQMDTYENIAVCAYSEKNMTKFNQYYTKIQKISPNAAKQLQQKLKELSQ